MKPGTIELAGPGKRRRRIAVVAVLFGLTVLLLLSIAFVSLISRRGLSASQERVRQLGQVYFQISEVERVVIDAETGQRGFIIAGGEEFLEPYTKALAEKDSILTIFQDQVRRYPEIQADLPELLELISIRDKELSDSIEVRRKTDLAQISRIVAAEKSRIKTDRIREILASMRSSIDAELESADEDFRTRIYRATLVMNFAACAALALGLLGLIFLLGHLRDQIRYMDMQREKENAERSDREKSQFLASMNHEIRTPLNAMLGFSELLENEVSSERGRRYLLAIQSSGASLAELINDILDLSKIESGALELSPEPVNLREFGRGIALIFEGRRSNQELEFGVTISESCPEVVMIDGLRVRQILINFIGNAFKFTDTGSIRVNIRATKGQGNGYDFVFSVKDTGRGVPEEKQAIIFEPFKQAEKGDEVRGGTGLGLSISRELALLMGGNIELTSEKGIGSDFRLMLTDVSVATAGAGSPLLRSETVNFGELPKSRILVVDDNPMNRDLIAGYLDCSHHEVHFAENGVEALKKMRSSPPDLVLMDIRMPVMSGDRARGVMLEDRHLASIPVIAVTASSLLSQEKRLRRAFDGYIRKPFSRATLFEGMRDVLVKRSSQKVEPVESSVEEEPRDSSGDEVLRVSDAELKGKLTSLKESRWDQLRRAMVISDIYSVSDELKSLAIQYKFPELGEYAEKMSSLADSFDLSGVEDLLNQFQSLIDKLS
jgi:signal transduction histidine kinase/DNA-binding response OmpR family regulator